MCSRWIFLILVYCQACLVWPAVAALPAPATASALSTAPTTAPSATQSAPVDQSTPLGALKMLTMAMEHGDAAVVRKMIYATTPIDERIADTIARMSAALARLRASAVTAFGVQEALPISGDPRAIDQAMTLLDSASQTIQGDVATIVIEGNEPATLHRVNGLWYVSVADMKKDQSPQMAEQHLADFNTTASVIEDVAADVAAGKYRTAQDARTSINARIAAKHAGMQPATIPAKLPTTLQSTNPAPADKP